MKKILLSLIVTFSMGLASATDVTTTGQQQQQTQASSSVSDATNQGNSQNITFQAAETPTTTTANVNYSGTQTVKNVPSVSGPQLVSSNDTCMGSTSGSVNIAGLGIGGGTTWVDGNCKMLKNSRELWNMGMKAAGLALMCTDPANLDALELTGFTCPQTLREKQKYMTVRTAEQAQQSQPTDPFVRARLGLPPLAPAK